MKPISEISDTTMVATAVALLAILWLLMSTGESAASNTQELGDLVQTSTGSGQEVQLRLDYNRRNLEILAEKMAEVEHELRAHEHQLLENLSCSNC